MSDIAYAVAPLRDCIREIQESPEMMEKDSENSTCIYERVRFPSKV